jgi:hypothetical protein
MTGVCEHYGQVFERNVRGRPRRFCGMCSSPPAAAARWREENPEARAAYNRGRRVEPKPKVCVQCGELFTPKRSDCRVCSDLCRWARDRARAA